MSRSYRESWIIDGSNRPRTKHLAKKKASRSHRHHEKVNLAIKGEEYVAQPSNAYNNPYDISDYRWYDGSDKYKRK